ncbi:MAG: choice-of-anchor J domain-containing protein [Bacteroidales bacterium]|nr:choice-of-anchor J domain-containing protein [Bacteroidales bacterium]
MKKNIIALGLIVAATFALTNCTKEIENPAEGQESAGIPFELVASTADTKTAAGDDLATVWINNDALSVFHAEAGSTEYGANDQFTITADNLASNKFTGTLSAGLEAGKSYDWYAVYPYKESYKTPATTNSGVIYLGSKYNEVQKQDGNDDMSHLAGANFPLYGKTKATPAAETPAIAMSHLTSVIELTVTNNTSEALTVNNVAFTAPEAIIGGYYISIAGEDVVYTGNGQYVNTTATLNVNDAVALASGKSAKFYIGFKPFVAKTGDVLKMSVNGYEKEVTLLKDMTFHPGKIKALSFDFDKIPVQSIPYNESFAESQGLFTVKDVSLGNLSYVWSADTKNKCMKATAYNGSDNAAESWLVSPNIDLADASAAYLSFEHLGNFFTDIATMKEEVKVKVRKDEGEWTDVSINYPESLGWNFVPSGSVSLAPFVGGNIQVAFVYTSSDTKAGTWEIRNFKVTAKQDQLLSFSAETASATLGEEFTEPVLDGAKTTVSYSSSNTSVATVAADGSVSPIAVGEAVITAVAEEDSEYFGASASYTLKVIAPLTGNEKYYVKVTEAPADWSGKYLIVFGTAAHATLSGKDLVATVSNLLITEDGICETSELSTAAFTVEKFGDAYSMKYPDGDKYFAPAHNSSSSSATAFSLTFNYTDNGVEIGGYVAEKSNTYYLYNNNNSYYRCYVSKTKNDGTLTTNYSLPTLYKLED